MDPALAGWLTALLFFCVVYVAMTLARKVTWWMGLGRNSDYSFIGSLIVFLIGVAIIWAIHHYMHPLHAIFATIGLLAYLVTRSEKPM